MVSKAAFLPFLQHLGTTPGTSTMQGLAQRAGHNPRTLQRWLRAAPRTTFYPNIRYSALGLVHLHAFLPDEQPTGDAARVQQGSTRLHYHHLLIPASDARAAQAALGHATTILTGDSWQENQLTGPAHHPVARLTPQAPTGLPLAYPLLIPVATTLLGRQRTMHEIWTILYATHGEQIWQYLPHQTRRWRRNGKAYVRRAIEYLNTYALVPQHVVRHHDPTTIEVFCTITQDATLATLREHTTLLEYWEGNGIMLVRAQGRIALVHAILTHPHVTNWWLITPPDDRAPYISGTPESRSDGH